MKRTTAEDKKEKERARYQRKREAILAQYKARYANGGYERFRDAMKDPVFVAKRKANWARFYAQHKEHLNLQKRSRVRYGLCHADYLRLVAEQHGACAICECVPPAWPAKLRLAIDHDHETGVVRGLLCPGCNIGIGHLRNSPATLRKAAMYLERHRKHDVSA